MLPDDALVEIFSFYVNAQISESGWYRLVHVCRRWRYVVFSSPHRLNLRLAYGGSRPLTSTPDSWSDLPLAVSRQYSTQYGAHKDYLPNSFWSSNIAAALKSGHDNRISEIHLYDIPCSHLETIVPAMQKPFPELTSLIISAMSNPVVVFPHSFLGGSAPRLRQLTLQKCSFPGIQKLLLSSKDLVTLLLERIPNSGYISPQAMVTSLSMMTRLEFLRLEFGSSQSRLDPATRPPPPLVRLILPALTKLEFQGIPEYLEDLVAQIDTPLLGDFKVTFFLTDPNLEVRQLHRFISRAEKFNQFVRATVLISTFKIMLRLPSQTDEKDDCRDIQRPNLEITCPRGANGQRSSLAQVCSSSLPLVSALEELDLHHQSLWKEDVRTEWLVLESFIAVKSLYLHGAAALCVCDALQELTGERVTGVLPALQNIFIWTLPRGPTRETVGTFVATRQLSGHPVAVHIREGREWKDITQNLLSKD